MQLNEIRKQALLHCAHDVMGLWVVTDAIARDAGLSLDEGLVPESVREQAMAVITEMLNLGLIEAVNPVAPVLGAEFESIAPSLEGALELINRRWDLLEGHWPSLGDICWFLATPAGKRLAEELARTD